MGLDREHSTMVMGEGKSIGLNHLLTLGKHTQLGDSMIRTALDQTKGFFDQWSRLAKNYGVSDGISRQIQSRTEEMARNL